MNGLPSSPPATLADARAPDGGPLLELREISCGALSGVSLAMRRGEATAIAGRRGAGKSLLARVAAGLASPSSGERWLRGKRPSELAGAERVRARLRVQFVPGDPDGVLDPRMRVIDAVSEAPIAHGLIIRAQATEYAGLVLNRVGIDPLLMRRYPHAFSPGERMRIALARALAIKPDVLVCDDPWPHCDPTDGAHLVNVLLDLRACGDLALLLCGRDRDILAHLCERVLVLEDGRLRTADPLEEARGARDGADAARREGVSGADIGQAT